MNDISFTKKGVSMPCVNSGVRKYCLSLSSRGTRKSNAHLKSLEGSNYKLLQKKNDNYFRSFLESRLYRKENAAQRLHSLSCSPDFQSDALPENGNLQSDLNDLGISRIGIPSDVWDTAEPTVSEETSYKPSFTITQNARSTVNSSANGSVASKVIEASRTVKKVSIITKEEDKDLFQMMNLVFGFAGPALVIWFSSPLMSLIDTAVIGRGSSLELAALGPGTIVCDNIAFLFTFLSVATSNLIATSMAHQDYEEATKHLSQLLFVALACGLGMIVFTFTCAPKIITDFVGKNTSLIPSAMKYAWIRGLAWPAVLIQSVAQSTCLGMQDAWGPLYVLVFSSLLNLVGDIVLCPVLGMGIAGAAWATMASQYVGCFLMLYSIHSAKKLKLSMSVPSLKEILGFIKLAAPIFMTTVSKTSFYAVLTRMAATMGNVSSGAHQVMIGLFSLCAVCGEPLSQTAQSYIPGFREGKGKNIKQARLLLVSLLVVGTSLGTILGVLTAAIPYKCPQIFTRDIAIIEQMRSVTTPLVFSLLLMPIVLSLEGTLMGGRDMKFMAASMLISFLSSAGMVVAFQRFNYGLVGNWWTLVAFQSCRMIQAALRLISSKSVLRESTALEIEPGGLVKALE